MQPELRSARPRSFQYPSLEHRTAIRILNLQHGSGEDPIECNMFTAELDDQEYQALSYEWGRPDTDDPTVTINGCPIRIRRNLYEALVQIRSATEVLSLWIDALCINQADIQEKNHQVGMMGKIYESAENVIIWVGAARDNSDLAMERLADGRLEGLIESGGLGITEQLALISLCHRSYWRRAWVVQEFHLAQSYEVRCGSKFVPGEKFGSALATITGFDDRHKYCKTIASSPANTHRVSREFRGSRLNTLARWLRVGLDLNSEATEPRDLIYAMLAVASDCNSSRIIPCYEKPLLDVYFEALAFCNTPLYTLVGRKDMARRLATRLGLILDEELEENIAQTTSMNLVDTDGMGEII